MSNENDSQERLASYAETYGDWLFEITPEEARRQAALCRRETEGKELYPESLSFAMKSMQFEEIACLIDNVRREDVLNYLTED